MPDWLIELIAPGSPWRGLILAVAVCVILFVGFKITKRPLAAYVRNRAHKSGNADNFLLIYRYLWMGAGFVFVLVSLSGSFGALGLSAAFVGMVFGWSLQAPVTGIAAWLMIILKRPFRIGDRIIVAGIIGDVTDINLTHIVLNQVGGTIAGEEKSGRGVLIPNATLFQQVIYNYTLEAKYILDEVPVRITFESDVAEAERICVAAARAVTSDIIDEVGAEPFTRTELAEWGILLRARYQTLATERQRISSEIVRRIITDFAATDRVEFAYPHTEVLYRAKADPPDARARVATSDAASAAMGE